MASVNQTRPHCVNQMGKTHSKPFAARHGRGTAWARLAMCESAFTGLGAYFMNMSGDSDTEVQDTLCHVFCSVHLFAGLTRRISVSINSKSICEQLCKYPV